MAKNTGKKRKRKNVRLHRTVRKTIAAIFMIMAVVVAAIPVEQLGTMQAKTQRMSEQQALMPYLRLYTMQLVLMRQLIKK